MAKLFTAAVQNYRAQFSEEEGIATQILWYNAFRNEPDEKMQEVMDAVIKGCLYFPNVAEIKKALDEYNVNLRYSADRPRQLERGQSRAESRENLERVHQYIEQFKADNFDKEAWVSEIRPFARGLFPDITDEIVWRNWNEINYAKSCTEMCRACLWDPRDCASGGYRPVLRIRSDGWMDVMMVACEKRVAKAG